MPAPPGTPWAHPIQDERQLRGARLADDLGHRAQQQLVAAQARAHHETVKARQPLADGAERLVSYPLALLLTGRPGGQAHTRGGGHEGGWQKTAERHPALGIVTGAETGKSNVYFWN